MEPHYSHLPVWAAGNVYIGGVKAWDKETQKLVCDKPVQVELVEKDGKYFLKTDLFDVVASFRGEPVTTASLGKAFEPDQAFENPDGTPISFDVDYNGKRRKSDVLPGPFAEASDTIRVL